MFISHTNHLICEAQFLKPNSGVADHCAMNHQPFMPRLFQQCVSPSLAGACNLQSEFAELLSVGLCWLRCGSPTGRQCTGTRRYVIEARCARHERPFLGNTKSDVCGRNYAGLFLAGLPRSLGRFIITEINKHYGCHLPVCFTRLFIYPPQHLFVWRNLEVSFMQFCALKCYLFYCSSEGEC